MESLCLHLKLTQHCKSTILQYKIKIKLQKKKERDLLRNLRSTLEALGLFIGLQVTSEVCF